MDISREHLCLIESDRSILHRIIATDESWVYMYDPCSKRCDMQWKTREEPCPAKPIQECSTKKLMLLLFFDSAGVTLAEFIQGTVSSEEYITCLRRMREAVRRKRPQLWQTQDFHLLQDGAPAHRSTDTVDYLQQVGMSTWTHPAYSPDLSPCDYWAFPRLKAGIKGHRFESLQDLETSVHRELRAIPRVEFTRCFNSLASHYEQCIQARGRYFEGTGTHPCLFPNE